MMGETKKSAGKSQVDGQPKREKKTRAAKKWALRLYVAGRSPKSQTAYSNLHRLCEKHIPGRYSIEVVDLLVDPGQAKVDQILAIPTLVRKVPPPLKRVIGDLSDSEKAMVALDLAPLGK
jgi:circadian clock protein KaiB